MCLLALVHVYVKLEDTNGSIELHGFLGCNPKSFNPASPRENKVFSIGNGV
jgi:hypothetical protein